MKAFYRLLIMLLVVSMLTASLASCSLIDRITGKEDTSDADNSNNETNNNNNQTNNNNNQSNNTYQPAPFVDYVSDIKFNPDSGRKYIETTVKLYVDGDTTHFNVKDLLPTMGEVPNIVKETGVLKARYIGIDTPESTGLIEPWGKAASNFTKTKLLNATSIILESNDGKWNADSTGERMLVWVWYKNADMTDYKCLNLEILQEGLARGSSSSETIYADACVKILNQSISHKLYVFSNTKDPDFYYGKAQPITLKELKTNIDKYANQRVIFEGVVIKEYDNSTVYIEEYDEESGAYFGMQVYYGKGAVSFVKDILTTGNRVRVAGSVQYYENGGTWQLSDIKYDPYDPMLVKLSSGHSAAHPVVDVNTILNGDLTFSSTVVDSEGNESITTKTFDYAYITQYSSVTVQNLRIKSVYTTQSGGSKGAMSITCEDENGTVVVVRTQVLLDSSNNNQVITSSAFPVGSVIDVRGFVDIFDGTYQIELFSIKDVTFH